MLKNEYHPNKVSQGTSETKYLFEVKNIPNIFIINQQKVTQLRTSQCILQVTTMDSTWRQNEKLLKGALFFWSIEKWTLFETWKPLRVQSWPWPSHDHINTCLNVDYGLQQATKLGYLFFESSRSLQASKLNLLKNQSQQERTQIFINLMLSPENPSFAGCMLSGIKSMFRKTNGSLAWLQFCPRVKSPLQTLHH